MTEENFWLMKTERVELLLESQGLRFFYLHFIHTFSLITIDQIWDRTCSFLISILKQYKILVERDASYDDSSFLAHKMLSF